jgi:S-DNA-T family DNA segregation ATPase FtsK/SpoIIIE
MTVETTIIFLIVIVALLLVWTIRRNEKLAVISPDLVTPPTPVGLAPPVSTFESDARDSIAEPTINKEPVSLLKKGVNIEVENSVTEDTELEFTIKKGEIKHTSEQLVAEFGLYDPQLDLPSYCYPPLEILNTEISVEALTEKELDIQKQKISAMFETCRIGIQTITATVGPRSVLYELVPSLGVRIAQIKQSEDDLVLTTGISGTKVIGHLQGKGTVGIEVPHRTPGIVSIYSVLNSPDFRETKMNLPIVLVCVYAPPF